MIQFKGEKYPMPIKIQPRPYTDAYVEDRLGADLSVKYIGNSVIRFKFITGIFALKGENQRKVFWEYARVRENRFGSDEVEFDLLLDKIEKYWVGVYDQEGDEIKAYRSYWEYEYDCRYKRDNNADECRVFPKYDFMPYNKADEQRLEGYYGIKERMDALTREFGRLQSEMFNYIESAEL